MSALSKILREGENGALMFWCPGCNAPHVAYVGEGEGPRWTWNGDVDKPTFSPSLLVKSLTWDPPVTPENIDQYRTDPWVQTQIEVVCHTFVQNGEIIFLQDCTHDLAGFTVAIPPFDEA